MTLEGAIRMSEALMALAFMQQSAEHLRGAPPERWLFILRLVLSGLLLTGFQPVFIEAGLLLLGVVLLRCFDGPYNGGSDRMSLLLLVCLFLARLAPSEGWREAAVGYLAAQLVLSYAGAGWIKLVNPDWRSGLALKDMLEFSVYPVSESVRSWAAAPKLLLVLSWALILFEALFPLALLGSVVMQAALMLAALFHLLNASLFGLNRFLWIWLAAYPCLIWFQQRVFGE